MDVTGFGLADVASRERYDRLFEECPDAFIQQSTYWAEVIQGLGPDEPILLLARDEGRDVAGLPLYLYRADPGDILTSVPQPGPLGGVFVRPGVDAGARERAYEALLGRALELARERRCLALTVISNPFHDDLALTRRLLAPALLFENFTQCMPVPAAISGRLPFEEPSRSSDVNRNLRKCAAAGLTVEACETDADFRAWYAIHDARHRAIGARPLDVRLFEGFRRHLVPRDRAVLFLVKQGDELAAGAWWVHHRRVMDAFMISMDARFAATAPNYLGTKHALLRARERGLTLLNWQSSPARASGVYVFKKQWGSREASYAFVTRLLCEPERVLAIGLEGANRYYANHYLVPFGFFEDRNPEGRYARA